MAVVLYTRAGCHLCDQALAVLREAGATVEVRDIGGDAALEARYGLTIPVVTVVGKVRFRGAVNRVLLRRLIDAQPV